MAHVTGYADPDHAAWYQAASDRDREQHLRASHWPAWRENPQRLTAEQHARAHDPAPAGVHYPREVTR